MIELITMVAPVFGVVAVGFFVRRAGLVGDRVWVEDGDVGNHAVRDQTPI